MTVEQDISIATSFVRRRQKTFAAAWRIVLCRFRGFDAIALERLRSGVFGKLNGVALWTGLKRVGIAPAEVIRRANIPVSAIRDDTPVSTMQFFALWRTLMDISNDPTGLRIATALDGGVMPPSFLAAYHARDFRDALQRVARFKRLCAPEDVLIEERNDESMSGWSGPIQRARPYHRRWWMRTSHP